ncbi:aspartic peptidase domain-containing protein [Mycena sp. CBHHK59/15]|nr:aspartic peptidase domain-containing protein [Mycena sp. CBHHK59/15]
MRLTMSSYALVAAVVLALSFVDARPLRAKRSASGMVTLPMRRIERNGHIHEELRHQQQINRGQRLLARAAGLPEPSDVELRANLERRALYVDTPALAKRYNIPSSTELIPAAEVSEVDGLTSSLIVGDDVTSTSLAKDSSRLEVDGSDTSFVTAVSIGTPARQFIIILDSGSGDFWVGSDTCKSLSGGGCGNHTALGEASSSSFVNTKKTWSVTYGSGAAAGDLVQDTVILAGMKLENHVFGIAHNQSESFTKDRDADGLMGLGKAGLSNQNTPTPVESLAKAGLINAAITSYRLPRLIDQIDNGEVTFGGLDESKFDTSSLVTLNATNSAFWVINMETVTVNGKEISIAGKTALMDTGTTLLGVPPKDAAAIHAKIPGAQLLNSGQYKVPCNTTASVALTFRGTSFPIDKKDLPFASFGRTTGDCQSGISSMIGTSNPEQWLVGDTFLSRCIFRLMLMITPSRWRN